jgi:SprT protein
MDKTYLQEVAEFRIQFWWNKLKKEYPEIQQEYPKVKLNNRLKTTAGRAFIGNKPQYIDLSLELFWEYTEEFLTDTIPHELAHLVAYTVFGDEGHGKGWYSVLNKMGIKTSRLHNMVNTKHEKRRAK